MKTTSFICLLMLLVFNLSYQSNAQRIYFSDTTNMWKWIGSHMPDPSGEVYVSILTCMAQDSIVEWNGKSYTLLNSNEFIFDALVRDDTATNRVYIKPLINIEESPQIVVTDTNEFIYMDYNLGVGDSLIMPLVVNGSSDSVSIHKILEVDSVLIYNSWYKKFWMEWLNYMPSYNHSFELIEGIGPLPLPISELAYEMFCFSNQGTVPPINYWNCSVSINETDQKFGMFRIYPIPATDQLTISRNTASTNDCQVKITNLLGQTLVASRFQKELTIDLSGFSAGLYVLQIQGSGRLLQSGKIYITK